MTDYFIIIDAGDTLSLLDLTIIIRAQLSNHTIEEYNDAENDR